MVTNLQLISLEYLDVILRKNVGDTIHAGVALDYTCFFVFRSKDKSMLDDDVNKFVVDFYFIIS
ncbi:protein of unknown function [Xenorhabdus doucetiae]|uniref:Uncharacterized protein n=1 Tax=Xenorhabdus doucetiae TaxID=351671 RepID=A0A068QMQ3_9GAMM|nr:hypothetical protein LY16_03631 [Xenorhabdus doucetiae]CDG15946.1 protein of unknown function [Xenorhabdus doucetiae]CDG15954.1 protein of unknown function [Xenorhabdus doucetiae]